MLTAFRWLIRLVTGAIALGLVVLLLAYWILSRSLVDYSEDFSVRGISAPVEIIVDPTLTTISDTVLTLYCDPFDPMAPALNVVAYDDDDGMGTLSALTASDDIRLVPGREYWVVVSTYGAGMYGSFTVQLSDNAAPCGGVAVDGATWGDLKGMYR